MSEPTARIVRERHESFDMYAGPFGYERVGFAIGDRVFWTGLSASHGGSDNATWKADVALAERIVALWNAGVK